MIPFFIIKYYCVALRSPIVYRLRSSRLVLFNLKNGMIYRIIIAILSVSYSMVSFAEYNYEKIEENGHVIHLLIIDPSEYKASVVSAHNQVFGREKVGDIAKRENADIAINAGFFEIGDNQDGRPTGTLVSNGQIYGLRTTKHACFVKNGNKYSVEMISPSMVVLIAGKEHKISGFNKFARGSSFYYYNNNWGKTTLSSFGDRNEIAIDQENKIIEVAQHGNISIPYKGYTVSFPKDIDISHIKVGSKVNFKCTPEYITAPNNFAIMGIPALILDGKIRDGLSDKHRHSRTAIGTRQDGKLVIVVAEHVYKTDVSDISIFEVRKIMEKENISASKATLSDLKTVLQNNLYSSSGSIGLTTKELAQFMLKQNCVSAINLDGGGSSTLYINGKYINQTIGDKDEAVGQKVVRPVSDAIVFRKK